MMWTRLHSAPVLRAEALETLLNAGENAFLQENYPSARNYFQRAVADHPGDELARLDLAEAERAQSDKQERDAAAAAALARMRRKAQSLVVPTLILDHTPLADAIESLRRESVRLDANPEQAQVGVKIFVRYPAGPTHHVPASSALEEIIPCAVTPICVSVRNAPLLDALEQVVGQVGMIMKVRAEGIYLTGLGDAWPDEMLTREWRIPPQSLHLDAGDLPASAARVPGDDPPDPKAALREKLKTFLEAREVRFPVGASVIYLSATHKLVVRNTQDNLDLVEALLEDFKPDGASPPPPANP